MRRHNRRQGRRQFLLLAFLTLVLIAVAVALSMREASPQTGTDIGDMPIAVHFVDVGQGDCAIVETPDGNILIDAGTAQSEAAIRRCIDELGITAFSFAVFTHPHADHIGSAAALVEAYPIEQVILPNAVSTSKTFERLIAAIETANCGVIEGQAGKVLELGTVKLELLAPCRTYDDLNNMSIVLRMTYGDCSFLFTGDAETVAEADMLANGVPMCDVLKVGHHGSSTSSSEAFIKAVAPQIAVISAGESNSYGHPHASVLERLEAHRAEILRTDLCGTITIRCDGTRYGIETEK